MKVFNNFPNFRQLEPATVGLKVIEAITSLPSINIQIHGETNPYFQCVYILYVLKPFPRKISVREIFFLTSWNPTTLIKIFVIVFIN